MSSKEKAKELVERFLPEVRGADRYNYNLESMNVFIAKECAIICAEEIMREHNSYYDTDGERLARANYNFWSNVKSEIQAL